jgi:hypothetical protein
MDILGLGRSWKTIAMQIFEYLTEIYISCKSRTFDLPMYNVLILFVVWNYLHQLNSPEVKKKRREK